MTFSTTSTRPPARRDGDACPLEGTDYDAKNTSTQRRSRAAAGESATHAGVTSWEKGEACRAATACFKAWLEARGGSGPGEIRDGIEQVRLFLEKHGASRFQAWDSVSTIVPNRAGFIRTDSHGETVFYILPAVWKSEVCQGRDARAVAAAMIARRLLDTGPGGKASQSLKVPALGQSVRLYCINAGIFEGATDG